MWNTEVLSKVRTSETDITKLNQLYSALYFMNLLPTNKTGENPLWESSEPYYDDIFTFWDTVGPPLYISYVARLTRPPVSMHHLTPPHTPA